MAMLRPKAHFHECNNYFQSNIEMYEFDYGLCAVTLAPQLRSAKLFDMDCSWKVKNGIMNYVDMFKTKYQNFLSNYANCMKKHALDLNFDNCYNAFIHPWSQSFCFKKLGPLVFKGQDERYISRDAFDKICRYFLKIVLVQVIE